MPSTLQGSPRSALPSCPARSGARVLQRHPRPSPVARVSVAVAPTTQIQDAVLARAPGRHGREGQQNTAVLPAAHQTLAPLIPMAATHHRPLHALLGGGAVADLLLWRRRNASAAAVAGATVVWFLFERAGYSLTSVLSNAVLLLVVILFFWAKSASLLNSGRMLRGH